MTIQHTWNQHVVKKGNKSIVFQYIINHTPISRADIAKATGLNKSTVSSLVSELLDENLIYESGPGESSGGRRPVMLLFNELSGFSIGIDLGVNYLLGILTDLSGNIVNEEKVHFTELPYEQIQEELFTMITTLIKNAPSSTYGVIGIGIGVPGAVNKEGEVLHAPNLMWENVKLKSIVEEKYSIPVIIANEANAGAYGEKKFGAGKDANNLVYVSAGTGIGAGLILNGQLYQGNNGFSGEMGHMTIEVDGPQCTCGSNGCWELYASEKALLIKAALVQKTAVSSEISLEALLKLAPEDPHILNLFKEIGTYLGVGINNIIQTFNPDHVIIGNRLEAAKHYLNNPIVTYIKEHTQPFHQNELEVSFSQLSTHSTALGVAAFTVESFLQIELVTT
ncbi:ROK family transcriptional regulator [Jeotgalibacillus proteolyticus]|uniref:ROK family protein n=1 Tax=Jeotgalibacillus proteolyticus TaxID=2082395 RepID=A0A2S5GCS1_9BACL|nr:ROK family protein [Jeotgalibacillus proteolyticus]PPA70693.1 ROK family protein [Jeotgalibacillus proteolyticus]